MIKNEINVKDGENEEEEENNGEEDKSEDK